MPLQTPFSSYVSGNSWLHRLDVRIKLLLVVAYVAAVFLASTWLGLLVTCFVLLAAALLSRVALRRLGRGLVPVMVIVAFTFVAHALTFAPQAVVVPAQELAPRWSWPGISDLVLSGSFAVSPAGALDGLYFALRIIALVCATTLLTLTSPLVRVCNAIAALMRPLARLRVPVEDIAMIFSIALRFIPLTAAEAEKVRFALTARGLRFGEGGPIRRLRAWSPVLIPLFVGLFRRADALAAAMESRCYTGVGRTRLRSEHLAVGDLTLSLCVAALLVVWGLLF